MSPSLPRHTVGRRAVPILSLVMVAVMGPVAVGPVHSAEASPAPAAGSTASFGPDPSKPIVAAEASAAVDAATVDPPAPVAIDLPVTVRQPIARGPSATVGTRLALQRRLDGILEKYRIPGLSVTILFPDGTSWVGTAGLAEVASKTPVLPETAFSLASVSKTFTAALVLALAQEGSLRLDAPVATYLPDLDLDPRITVRQLLDHTSGLHDFFFHPRIDKALLADPARRWTEADAMRYVGKPYFKPGRGWHYSNTNYVVLGLLAEQVGGDGLEEQLRDRFFEPLGLRRTWYQPAEPAWGPVAHGYRFAPGDEADTPIDLADGSSITPFASVVTAAAGAGGIAASSSDVARWVRALFGGGVLRADTLGAMLGDVTRTERYHPTVPYGLGVQSTEVGGRPSLGHSGRLLGFRSVARWLPRERIAIAVLTNQSRTDPGIIARALLKIALRAPDGCACVARR